MSSNATDPPANRPASAARAAYLRQLANLTTGGIGLALVAGALSIWLLQHLPTEWQAWILLTVVAFGYLGSEVLSSATARLGSSGPLAGLLSSCVYSGFVLGYCLNGRVWGAPGLLGSSLATLLAAAALTVGSAAILVAARWQGRRDLRFLTEGPMKVARPLIVAWLLTFVFPGKSELIAWASVAFVALPLAGLLYTLNWALHRLPPSMVFGTAQTLTLNTLFLFWALSVALTRLARLTGPV